MVGCRLFSRTIILCAGLLAASVGVSGCAENRLVVEPDLPEPPSIWRAVSLKVLQERLQVCQRQKSCTAELNTIAGLTRLRGYMVDTERRDIVLIGEVVPSRPALHTEDIAVALRNANWQYAKREGNTLLYEAPGCSIDPEATTLSRLNAIEQTFNTRALDDALGEWREVCKQPEKVRVFGIPFDSRFSKIIVEADYFMKRLVDGTERTERLGFPSLMDLRLKNAKEALARGKFDDGQSSLNRFWFQLGKVQLDRGDGVVMINAAPVVLSTEAEYADHLGQRSQTGTVDIYAAEFARNFTDHFDRIARRWPVYADLENLFRLVVIAEAMKLETNQPGTKFQATYLLNGLPVESVAVPRELPGHANVKDVWQVSRTVEGELTTTVFMQICGGVSMRADRNNMQVRSNAGGRLGKFRKSAIRARPQIDSLFWDLADEIVALWKTATGP